MKSRAEQHGFSTGCRNRKGNWPKRSWRVWQKKAQIISKPDTVDVFKKKSGGNRVSEMERTKKTPEWGKKAKKHLEACEVAWGALRGVGV